MTTWGWFCLCKVSFTANKKSGVSDSRLHFRVTMKRVSLSAVDHGAGLLIQLNTSARSIRYEKSVPRQSAFKPKEVTDTMRFESGPPRNTGPPESPEQVPPRPSPLP